MTASASTARAPWVLLFVAVALIAMNMRMTITGVGPLIEQIAADQGVSPATLGILASVPLLAWGSSRRSRRPSAPDSACPARSPGRSSCWPRAPSGAPCPAAR
ncbi:hypothetical protein [Leucobacter soli]|uniref:hypothetical protein n=1 Tax=Leucobacter soli TaxID=2812850 RepID=UPI0036218FEE